MTGLLCNAAWPSDHMNKAFRVAPQGSTLVLTQQYGGLITKNGDGSNPRPSAAGDVLARNPIARTWEGRPPGTSGPWETFAVNGALAVYNGDGKTPEGFLYWPQVPNL
jgi:hypothetical protein